jgi:prepilin-type N-terminal cleavage/methylation domain-containing protein/prepilin-type processing-associated H-X9-DG protein
MQQILTVSRRGLTLIELLVVIGIIGLLVLMIIPAVQASREAARKSECINNLKQIGVAVAGFESANRVFPSGVSDDSPAARALGIADRVSLQTQILPYLEQRTVFDSINFAPKSRIAEGITVSVDKHGSNDTAKLTRVGTFMCPSDNIRLIPGNNYRANTGPHPYWIESSILPSPNGGGSFLLLKSIGASEITDGLSMTAGLSERVMGSGANHFDQHRDFWYAGAGGETRESTSQDEMIEICSIPISDPSQYLVSMGQYWLPGGMADTLYNHTATPNVPFPDCALHRMVIEDRGDHSLRVSTMTARSRHAGGVNVLLMDGSVRFVRNSIDRSTWRALSTRAGGETLGEY